jgi:tellurite resistance protein
MAPDDLEPIVTIALMASQADGLSSPEELVRLKAAAQRLGVANPDAIVDRLSAGRVPLSELAKRLSDDKARRLAYQTALLVCQADGETNPAETQFLGNLRTALGLTPMAVSQVEESAVALASAPVPASPAPAPAATTSSSSRRCSPALWSCCRRGSRTSQSFRSSSVWSTWSDSSMASSWIPIRSRI